MLTSLPAAEVVDSLAVVVDPDATHAADPADATAAADPTDAADRTP
jgi:hypothetical protein